MTDKTSGSVGTILFINEEGIRAVANTVAMPSLNFRSELFKEIWHCWSAVVKPKGRFLDRPYRLGGGFQPQMRFLSSPQPPLTPFGQDCTRNGIIVKPTGDSEVQYWCSLVHPMRHIQPQNRAAVATGSIVDFSVDCSDAKAGRYRSSVLWLDINPF
jgi:hypothetical protein